ncbi:MAG: acetyl-CoA carboxylase biotin carboxyl carrier protein subunit [Ignavibacteria bacterium]|nr:MAG: acetyl-CoA carboxylase biotin carboxyl carrier protein subunit [Ignavibacteria bacterium]
MNEDQSKKALVIDDTAYETRFTTKFLRRKSYAPPNPKHVLAYIPGTIQEIYVTPGQQVKWGDSLLVLEAMKMRNDVTADIDGTIKSVNVSQNEKVMKNQLLIEFE